MLGYIFIHVIHVNVSNWLATIIFSKNDSDILYKWITIERTNY